MATTPPALTAPMPTAIPNALAAPPTGPRCKLRIPRERCLRQVREVGGGMSALARAGGQGTTGEGVRRGN